MSGTRGYIEANDRAESGPEEQFCTERSHARLQGQCVTTDGLRGTCMEDSIDMVSGSAEPGHRRLLVCIHI